MHEISSKYLCLRIGIVILSNFKVSFRMSLINPFMPTVRTFAVRETRVSRTANIGTVGMNGLIVCPGMSGRDIAYIALEWQSF